APAAAPAGSTASSGESAAPAGEKIPIVATTQMGLAQWEETTKRAPEALPNIELTITQTNIAEGGWAGYSDRIVTQIAGGEQLDVIMIAIEGLRLLTDKNILVPLDDFFAADPEQNDILQNDIHKTLREMLQVDGKQMEYPFSWNNMVMYYNTQIFEEKGLEPPTRDWTWDDFLETCLQIADVQGGAEDLYAYSFWGSGMFGMAAWYFNNDTSPLNDEWTASNLMDPKVAETLQFLADLILVHKVSPNPQGWDEWPQFHAGHLAMRTCGRWCIGGSLAENFTSYDLQYQPHAAGPFKTVAGTDGWGISSSARDPNAAWEVVKLLSGTEASLDMVRAGGNIPALRSVAEMPEFTEYGPPNTAIFYESLDYAKTVPSPTNFNIVDPILNRHYQTIWNGEKTVEEALAAAHEEVQAEMDKLQA
ncbi:MAG TPA: sugar ABC transporter substrate-binding protein, partial [Caldilineaceae bacterium]|nr:sugar ABC transporter substrate-binding protein [Caldilineaceae bacterium]